MCNKHIYRRSGKKRLNKTFFQFSQYSFISASIEVFFVFYKKPQITYTPSSKYEIGRKKQFFKTGGTHGSLNKKYTFFNSQGQLRDHYLGKVKLVSNVKIDRYQEMKALLRNVRETKNAARDAAKEAKQRRQDS